MFDYEKHLEHRRGRQQRADASNPRLPGLTTVEFNPSELCNRKCSFCPRSNPSVYPNRKLFMAPETAAKAAADLGEAGYTGDFHFTGFGEPLLHPQLAELVQGVRKHLPKSRIEVVTNGDFLTANRLLELSAAGVDHWQVDCYDGPHQLEERRGLFESNGFSDESFRLREHYDVPDAAPQELVQLYGFNNRAGAAAPELSQSRRRPCHLPFYKMFIDHDGAVRLCCNDWRRREAPLGNLLSTHLAEIWTSPQAESIRASLAAGDRSGPACRGCDVDGCRTGAESVQVHQLRWKQAA